MESNLASLEAEVATVRARALTAAGQVATLMRLSGKGLALLDGELQLTACNHRFATLAGVPPQALETDFPVDELFRRQAHAGLIVSENDEDPEAIEIEIARRVASLRTEPEGAALPQQGTDGSQIVIKADVIPDGGGLVLTIDEADT